MRIVGAAIYVLLAILGLYCVLQGMFGHDYAFLAGGALLYLLGRDVRKLTHRG